MNVNDVFLYVLDMLMLALAFCFFLLSATYLFLFFVRLWMCLFVRPFALQWR